MNLWTTLTCQNSASVSVVFMEVCSPRGVCGAVWTEGRRAHQQQGVSHQEPKCYTSRLGALSGAFKSK